MTKSYAKKPIYGAFVHIWVQDFFAKISYNILRCFYGINI